MHLPSERFERSENSRIQLEALQTHLFTWWSGARLLPGQVSTLERILEKPLSNANCTAPQKARSNSLPSSTFFFVWSFFEPKNRFLGLPRSIPEIRPMRVLVIIITRKGLRLNSHTNQRPSSKSVLMEVRFVTAETRGFFSPAHHDRGFAAQFLPQTTGKKG